MTRIRTISHELCMNLEDQVRVWRHLLDLSQAQLAALQVQDVHSVHAILQEIEVAMLDRSRTEIRRGMLLEQAALELGVPATEVTRTVLQEHSDAPIAEALGRAADELRSLVGALDDVVARNRAMLEQELEIIELLVRGATEDRSVKQTYGKTGSQTDRPRLRLLDAQV
jgi:hypothetical protein